MEDTHEGQAYCFECKVWKPVSEFYKNRSRRCGYQRQCIPCQKAHKVRVKDNPIPEGTICAFEHCDRLATQIDHNHLTGELRLPLCKAHNTLLGKAEEDPIQLIDALVYLKTTTHEIIN